MGCDFYTYYVVRIQYKSGDEVKIKTKEIEETRQRHYFWEIEERDSDFEELNDYYDRCHLERQRQVDNELSQYPRKDIYKNEKWLCIASSKEKYINMYKSLGITESDIIGIWKEGDYHYR
jgi:hypothetical protein